jgi:hypothetical protein
LCGRSADATAGAGYDQDWAAYGRHRVAVDALTPSIHPDASAGSLA